MSEFQNYRAISLYRYRVLEDGETFTIPHSGVVATGPGDVVWQTGPDHFEIIDRDTFDNGHETTAIAEDQTKTPATVYQAPIHGGDVPPGPHPTELQPTSGETGST